MSEDLILVFLFTINLIIVLFVLFYDRWLIRDDARFNGWRKVRIFWSPSLINRNFRFYRVKYIDSFGNRTSKYCSVYNSSIQWDERRENNYI
jgi:hypothetical protein